MVYEFLVSFKLQIQRGSTAEDYIYIDQLLHVFAILFRAKNLVIKSYLSSDYCICIIYVSFIKLNLRAC